MRGSEMQIGFHLPGSSPKALVRAHGLPSWDRSILFEKFIWNLPISYANPNTTLALNVISFDPSSLSCDVFADFRIDFSWNLAAYAIRLVSPLFARCPQHYASAIIWLPKRFDRLPLPLCNFSESGN